jgi:hypothetical protein
LEKHGAITNKGGKFTIERYGEAKLLRNGKLVSTPSDLVHLDRLLFGALQYYVFVEPSKMKPNDPYYTFEAMQDEIAKASGIIAKDTKNMTQGNLEYFNLFRHYHYFCLLQRKNVQLLRKCYSLVKKK